MNENPEKNPYKDALDGAQFLKLLTKRSFEPRKTEVVGVFLKDARTELDPGPLPGLMGLTSEALSPAAENSLTAIEAIGSDETKTLWSAFKWRVLAFFSIQDAFQIHVYEDSSPEDWFRAWYFYFESKHLLVEAICCGLNGLHSATTPLLRLFLEFSLTQGYFLRLGESTGRHNELKRWFTQQRNPSWGSLLKWALPNHSFAKPIRDRVQFAIKKLSSMGSHPYHPDESVRQHSPSPYSLTFEGLFFWIAVDSILQAALWVYYVNVPMLFCPVDIVRKFGFNPPVGLVDSSLNVLVEKSMSREDYSRFSSYANSLSETQSLLQWYARLPNLSEDEITSTWSREEEGKCPDSEIGFQRITMKMRALREAMTMKVRKEEDWMAEITEEQLQRLTSYGMWEKRGGR